MIKLIDLIELAGVRLRNSDFKIHCATPASSNSKPLEAFFDGKFKEWQAHQTKKNFGCKYILSLIHLGNDRWLFAGVYAVMGSPKRGKWEGNGTDHWRYPTREVNGLEHLTGKAMVQFKRPGQQAYMWGGEYVDKLFLVELLNQRMTIGDCPGYKSILLSYRMLQTVVRESNPSWQSALSNVAGVYLITDTSDGKLYVGSAYGGKGIWQRWVAYAKNGHGGNKEIKKLLSDKGSSHTKYFQFSLLEVCDLDSAKEYVIEREAHWKEVLKTREFGLNKN
jgi:hypothetical protein